MLHFLWKTKLLYQVEIFILLIYSFIVNVCNVTILFYLSFYDTNWYVYVRIYHTLAMRWFRRYACVQNMRCFNISSSGAYAKGILF